MSLIELTDSDANAPITLNLAHVIDMQPSTDFTRDGEEVPITMFTVGFESDGSGIVREVEEEYREIVAVIRTHQGAAFIPARDLIARARADARVNVGGDPE